MTSGPMFTWAIAALCLARIICAAETPIPDESAGQAAERHRSLQERKAKPHVICHRGASEFAPENTLEAYRATFELGGDGNEIDIRATKDGVLICFHDDWVDRILAAQGLVSDYTWKELQEFPFRDPGPFGKDCHIPTLVEVLQLHRIHGGLLHLDIKQPALEEKIVHLLERMDMWEHIAHCNAENAAAILADKRLNLLKYKAPGLWDDRGEMFPEIISPLLKNPGHGLIVDDPRGVILAMGRKLGRVSQKPVSRLARPQRVPPLLDEKDLLLILREAEDWNRIAADEKTKAASARRITERAWAAERLAARGKVSPEAFALLEKRVRERTLHKDWKYHGADGAAALRALILLNAPNAVDVARFALWRDDPALAPLVDPRWNNPRAWTDFRPKMVVFPALEKYPGEQTQKLCRDYLALTDEQARQAGPPMFKEAARTLLAVSPNLETALELLNHRLRAVRGEAILSCLKQINQPWAREALQKAAPHALDFVPPP